MAATLEELSPVQVPVDLAHGNGAPDPRALDLVGELQRQLPDARVLLFGSRAIGDWWPGSDIDLAVIGGSKDAAADALAQLRSQEPHLRAQLFHFTPAEFDELRTSLPHVAGQVQAHGLTAAGEHLPSMDQDNPWPGVQELLHAARRKLEAALILFGTQPLTGEIVLSVHATLERCLKAALGAEGVDFRDHLPRNRQHNLCTLAELLAAETPVDPTGVIPVEYLHELDAYQDTAPYKHDQQVEWPTTDNEILPPAVQRASLGLADHALATLGKTPRDVGYEHRIGSDALGGFGTVTLDHYAHAKVGARELQHIENTGRVRDLHTLLGSRLTEAQLARVESNWYTHNVPDDVLERLVAVMTNPATWLDLLVPTRYRENDADVSEGRDTPPSKG
ncbi:MAG: nucleotidyltransferase domain-containing protein [Caldilineaceae bacterium]|nr:nucleotidyltransferase domain-containing protein [Caldilineaceae bacterium]